MEREKLLALYGAIGAWLHLDNADSEEIARKIVSELFPPMAKPLVWVHGSSGPYSVFYDYADKVWSSEYRTHWMANFASIAEAEAACEAHHQARFLEMMA